MEIFRQITANNITLIPYPFTKELAMEAYLLENEEILILDQKNFNEVEIIDAEIAIREGRRDKDGRIDIFAKYGEEYLAIIELKLEEIDKEALKQLEDYLEKKEKILDKFKPNEINHKSKWIGVLVGSSITEDIKVKLKGRSKKDIPIAGLVINRFRGENNEILVTSDTYFSFNYSIRDLSEFIFNGKSYNKSRLVNRIIRHYVEDRDPSITYAKLREIFKKDIQGTYGVFDKREVGDEIYKKTGRKRFYINHPLETIELVDGTIVTCNQWDTKNIKKFLSKCKDLKIKIEPK